MIAITEDLSIKQNMKPYNFINIYCLSIGQNIASLKKHQFMHYLTRAKLILAHLRGLDWTDNDISFFTSQFVEALKAKFYPTEFNYVSSFLLAINDSPKINLPASEIPLTPELCQWIQQEVDRIKKSRVPNL